MKDSLEKKLLKYAESDAYAFHMPGHKRVMDPLGGQAMKLDITEIDGFDNLHDAEGVLRDEMEAAAEMYGARETLFSVNGSTCALLAAISAAVPRGGTILIERACHMAVYHAAYLRELRVLYVEDVCPGEVGDGICFDAIVITSPTYEGVVKDVRAWAAFAHAYNASLIVDEAHGAHLGFHPYFPESAVRCGADVVVQSTHKTLPAMTQTALLHNVSGRVSSRRLHFFMDIYETSSPSYVLMASITSALRLVREQGAELFEAYARRLQRVRRELCSLKYFRLAGGEDAVIGPEDGMLPYPVGTRMDPGKLVLVRVRQSDVSKREIEDSRIDLEKYSSRDDADELLGRAAECAEDSYGAEWLYGVLRDEYHLQMEMRTGEYCLAMTSFADTDEGFERLVTAMREIDERVEREMSAARARVERPGLIGAQPEETDDARADFGVDGEVQEGMPGCKKDSGRVPVVLSEVAQVMKISDALDAECETVALERAAGRVCADFVILYPPDVPLIVPGEIYTEEKVSEIRVWMEKGFSVMGVDV